MTEPDIIVDETPGPGIREAILRPLREYNISKVGPIAVEPLAILLRDPESGTIVGGLWGQSVADWLYVDLLSVPEKARARGIGSALMRKAEEIAVKRNCAGVWLNTGSFQAPAFSKSLAICGLGHCPIIPEAMRPFIISRGSMVPTRHRLTNRAPRGNQLRC